MWCIQILKGWRSVYGRDSMSYQIMMPLKGKDDPPKAAAPSRGGKANDLKQDLLADSGSNEPTDDNVIDGNSLKGIAAHVSQENVGKLQVIGGQMVVIEKLRVDAEPKEKYEIYQEYLSGLDEEYRKMKAQQNGKCEGNDDRTTYNEKIADSVLSKIQTQSDTVKCKKIDRANNKMFVTDPLSQKNDLLWINQCYYCDLVK